MPRATCPEQRCRHRVRNDEFILKGGGELAVEREKNREIKNRGHPRMLPFIREKTYKLPITCRLEAWENMAKQIISTINEHYRKKDESTLQCPQSAAKRTDDDMPANLESCGSVTEKRLKSFQKFCKCSCCRLSMFMLSIIRSSCRNVSAT